MGESAKPILGHPRAAGHRRRIRSREGLGRHGQSSTLLLRQGEPERVPESLRSIGQRLDQKKPEQVGVQFPVIPPPDLSGNLFGVMGVERRQIRLLDPVPL